MHKENTDINMAHDLKETFEKSCRLCAKVGDVTLMIFSAEAEAMTFQKKLSKYLLLEVHEDDNLPKNICINCCSTLYSVCDFVDSVHESQKTLASLRFLLDKVQSPVSENIFPPNKPTINFSTPTNSKGDVSSDLAPLYGLDENVTIKLINEKEYFKTKYCENIEMLEFSGIQSKNVSYNILYDEEGVDKDNICRICNNYFFSKIDLMQHQRVHINNIICRECGMHFRTRGNLMSHVAVHATEINALTCNICGKNCTSLHSLKTHSITHSSQRTFECKVCKKTFKRNQELKFHMNSHTGSKPYQCPYCDKTFSRSANCYLHRRRKHPEDFFKEKREKGKRSFKKAEEIIANTDPSTQSGFKQKNKRRQPS